MTPFILDNKAISELSRIKLFAETNPYSIDDLLDMRNGAMLVPGDNDNNICFINFGYKIVFSIEEFLGMKKRTLSMSVQTENRVPSPEAVKLVMEHLGFKIPFLKSDVTIVKVTDTFSYVQIEEKFK